MTMLTDLESKTQGVNRHLAERGLQLCWGGNFSVQGNVFHRGAEHLLRGMPVIFPICLNNGYYNEGQLENLARGIGEFDNNVYAFLTDGPSKHNYMALGYSESKAITKTRLEANGLLNRFRRGLYALGDSAAQKFSYFGWDDIYRHPEWIKQSDQLHSLYNTDEVFQHDVDNTTRQVLSHRKKLLLGLGFDVRSDELSAEDVTKAIKYTLDEVAFVTVCPRLLGVEGICYLYKENWPVLEKLADGVYTGHSIPSVGFLEFHVLPEVGNSNTPVILTPEQLNELSSQRIASQPHRPKEAPQASLRKAILQT